MQFEIIVELKKEVLDVEGRAIKEALHLLGKTFLGEVKATKRFVVHIQDSEKNPLERAEELARDYFTNPVSESFSVRRLDS